MKYKRIAAVSLAVTMALGSSAAAFAADSAEGTGTGEGKLEGTVNTDVFSVVIPTIPADFKDLEFILDPEGLLEKTNGGSLGTGLTFEQNATLFFKNSATGYSSTSNELTIKNKSSIGVDVALSAKLTGAEKISLSTDRTFKDDTSASMYLAVKHDLDLAPIITTGAKIDDTIATSSKAFDHYDYTWNNTDKKYEYTLDPSAPDSDFDDAVFKFQLTGAANSKGDWSALADVKPAVELTWHVAKHSDGYASSTTVTPTSNSVTLNLPTGVTFAGMKIRKTDGAIVNGTASHYSLSGKVLTFSTSMLSLNTGATLEVNYSDGKQDLITIQ